MRRLRSLTVCLLLAGCRSAAALEQPLEERWIVRVSSSRLPSWKPWVSRFAFHSWIDVKQGHDQAWTRVEVWDRGRMRLRQMDESWACRPMRWERPVQHHALWSGDEARAMGAAILAAAPELGARYEGGYRAWPGPNSNTFIAELLREVDGLDVELDHNAVGKDYTSFLALRPMSEGTGLALDTPLLGVGVGLLEGVELHALQLQLGVSLFPPGLELPLLPALAF